MKSFGGPVLFLDRSDINTDEIIPAKYLTTVSKEDLKPHLLEDLKLPGFDRFSPDVKAARVIVTRANFGCGSSREHAPWALEVNNVAAVIAESFARIFRQNMFNCGMLAIALPKDEIDSLFEFKDEPILCSINLEKGQLSFSSPRASHESKFDLAEFDKALVHSGGWVEFADQRY
ncbi:MAG: leuD [Acidobacteria bacterium]|jgi:3-isopropylmalate/(R)-2-methylmalate dehydratase small subunit|nr:leuD [Acidobacteriota bacterium]